MSAPPTQGRAGQPRCLHPMKYQETGRHREDVFPVCWRPLGHPPGRHTSKASWERGREYRRTYARPPRGRRQDLAAAA